ncbi:MAG: diacylglycerol kinase family protein [Saprospiraceae bacterium]|nr:diacylglycerol kinase family protein [Saprospiraceae bacterium]
MSLQKRLASFRYAFQGIGYLFSSQVNARIHAVATVLVVTAGIVCHISTMEWLAIIICVVLVIALEAVNTAIETLTDLVSPGNHPLAGKAKDVAAASVLLAAIGSVVVGVVIFGPRLLS